MMPVQVRFALSVVASCCSCRTDLYVCLLDMLALVMAAVSGPAWGVGHMFRSVSVLS